MLSTFLISYDLGGPETSAHYQSLIKAIQAMGAWAKPLESFWLIKTSNSASVVRTSLQGHLDSNDKLLVIDVTGANWSSYGLLKEVSDWMKVNM